MVADKAKKDKGRMIVRKAKAEDAGEWAALLYDTVHAVNSRDYTKEQIHAWAPAVPSPAEIAERQKDHLTWVAVADERIVGFVELKASGYIDCFYCHKDFLRQGIGSLLFNSVEAAADKKRMQTLFADVSITALPFFTHLGFAVLEERQMDKGGVALPCFRMELVL